MLDNRNEDSPRRNEAAVRAVGEAFALSEDEKRRGGLPRN